MSEEINTNTNTGEQVSTVQRSGLPLKDLLVPVSIIMAGLFVGAGLYFSGGPTTDSPQGAALVQNNEATDNTSKVEPPTEDDHIKGNLSAPIKIVEFSDFDCPFCNRFHDVMNDVVEKYPEDVVWAYRQFPLEQLHPQAPAVSLASECVAELGGNEAFWVFADGYLAARGSGNKSPHGELIPELVTMSGVDAQAFTDCFESDRLLPLVQADIDQAVETGGRGTPWSVLIGPTGKTYPINGALPQSAVEQLIEVAKQEA